MNTFRWEYKTKNIKQFRSHKYPGLSGTCWPSGAHFHGSNRDIPALSLQKVLQCRQKKWINYFPAKLYLLVGPFTSERLSVKLPLLNEPAEHLSLHEDLQESPYSLGRDGLQEALSLKRAGSGGWGGGGGVAVLAFAGDEEWIVAN